MEKFNVNQTESNEQSSFEKIKNAALLYEGQVFEAISHGLAAGLILEHIKNTNLALYEELEGDEWQLIELLERTNANTAFEGFTTTTGRFVTRQEALEIARNAEQIKGEDNKEELWSENVKR